MKRRGAQRVRFTIERKLEWWRPRRAAGIYSVDYLGRFLSEPNMIAGGRTLAELRRNLVTAWRRAHDAIVTPTGRPPRLPQDRRSRRPASPT